MRSFVLLALLLMLAAATAQSPPAAPAEDEGNDGDLDSTDTEDVPVEATSDSKPEMRCPSSAGEMCSGKGKCEATEEQTVVCNCIAGYHGDDCSEMDDKFDVYWNRIMLESKNAVLKPKMERASRRVSQLDNRIKAYNKRTTDSMAEERGFVDRYVALQTKFLDDKEKAVDKHQAAVVELLTEVMTLREKLHNEVVEMTSTERARVKDKEEKLKEREDRNAQQFAELKNTVLRGVSLGENSRFHRIVEHWALCNINPSAPACQKPDPKPDVPGVHLVVETKKPAAIYPSKLAASEKEEHEAEVAPKKRLL